MGFMVIASIGFFIHIFSNIFCEELHGDFVDIIYPIAIGQNQILH